MFNRRQFLQTSAATISGLTLSSCGWTLADVRPTVNSNTSDVLYIYTWAGYTDEDLLERFRQATGIKVIADVYDSNEAMLARIQASGGGGYSIIYPSDYMVKQMSELNLLTEIDKSRLIGLDSLFPRFQNPVYDPKNKYSIPISWGTTGLIYNQKKLEIIPEDWDYLWQYSKKISKRFTLLNDTREVMGATLKMLGYSYNATDPAQIKEAYEKLSSLKSVIASFTSDGWRTQILSGDLLVAMCYSSDANEIIAENPDLAYVLPKSGSSLWVDTLVIPRRSPNVDAAYAWLNFILQPEIAAELTTRLSFATPNKLGFQLLSEEVKNNASLFASESALANCEGIQPVGDKISEIYDLYWTKLTSS